MKIKINFSKCGLYPSIWLVFAGGTVSAWVLSCCVMYWMHLGCFFAGNVILPVSACFGLIAFFVNLFLVSYIANCVKSGGNIPKWFHILGIIGGFAGFMGICATYLTFRLVNAPTSFYGIIRVESTVYLLFVLAPLLIHLANYLFTAKRDSRKGQ